MNSMWKRSFALLLSLVMVFGMVPVNAFAEDSGAVTCDRTAECLATADHAEDCLKAIADAEAAAKAAEEAAAKAAEEAAKAAEEAAAKAAEEAAKAAEEAAAKAAEEAAKAAEEAANQPPVCNKQEDCPAAESHAEDCLKAIAEAEAAAKAAEEAAKATNEPPVCTKELDCPVAEGHAEDCLKAIAEAEAAAAVCTSDENCEADTHNAECPYGPCTLTEGCELVKGHPGECTGVDTFEEFGLAGEGTAESPYLINNIDDLKWFRDDVNRFANDGSSQYAGKYFKLTADIDLNNEEWTPIGSTTRDHGSFYGSFDGDGHTISNLYISQHGTGSGFFAKTSGGGDGPQATVKNITFHNVDVDAGNSNSYAGGVIANSGGNTVVSNVHLTGDVYVNGYGYVGGIVGHGYPKMNGCSVNTNAGSYIHSNYWCAGALVGYAGEGTSVSNSTVENISVWGAYGGAGAAIGLANDHESQVCSLTNVSATNVEVSGADYYSGYIAGNSSTAIMNNVTATKVTLDQGIVDPLFNVSIGDTRYPNLQAAANAGGEITLHADITLTEVILLSKSVTINGNGHKISSSATRVFRLTTENIEVTMNNVNMVNTAVRSGSNDIRGVSIDDTADNAKLTLNSCSVDFKDDSAHDWSYAVNDVESDSCTITISGGTYEGANVFNIRGYNHTINISGVTATSLYKPNDTYMGVVVKLNGTGSTVTVSNSTFNGGHAMAFEENNSGDNDVTFTGLTNNLKHYIAKVDSTYYYSLEEASNAENDIVLINSVELNEEVEFKSLSAAAYLAEKNKTVKIKFGENGVLKVPQIGKGVRVDFITDIANSKVSYKDGAYRVEANERVVVLNPGTDEAIFESLADALKVVENGDTITLCKSIVYNKANGYSDGTWHDGVRYTGDKSFTIDLGGNTISCDDSLNDYLLYFKNTGAAANTITVTNGTISGGKNLWNVITVGSGSSLPTTLNLNGVTVNGDGSGNSGEDGVVKARNGSVVNVNSGTVINTGNALYGVQAATADATVNINDGAVVNANWNNSGAIAVTGTGTMNINGGTVNATGAARAVQPSSSGTPVANIKGGVIKGAVVSAADLSTYPSAKSTVVITGGEIDGTLTEMDFGGSGVSELRISGGRFTSDPSIFVVPGFKATKSADVWTVEEMEVEDEKPDVSIDEKVNLDEVSDKLKEEIFGGNASVPEVKVEVKEDLSDKVDAVAVAEAVLEEVQKNEPNAYITNIETLPDYTLTKIQEEDGKVTVTFDIKPVVVTTVKYGDNIQKIETEAELKAGESYSFELPIFNVTDGATHAHVTHKCDTHDTTHDLGNLRIDPQKNVVVITTSCFSPFTGRALNPKDVACKIGDMPYETLDEALEKAQNRDIIYLENDITLPVNTAIGAPVILTDKDITINLNGNDLVGTVLPMTLVVNGGSYNDGIITTTNPEGKKMIASSTTEGKEAFDFISDVNGTFKLVVENGAITGIDITAGTVEVGKNGGTGTQAGHKLQLLGTAKLIAPAGKPLVLRGPAVVGDNASVEGTVMLEKGNSYSATITTTKTLDKVESATTGCKAVYLNNKYQLVDATTVAMVGETEYSDVGEALNAAATAGTVATLVDSVPASSTENEISTTSTLDLNGHSIGGIKASGANVTVTLKNAGAAGVTVELGNGDKFTSEGGAKVIPLFESGKGYGSVTILTPGQSNDVARTYFMEVNGFITIGADGKVNPQNNNIKYLVTAGRVTQPFLSRWTEQDGASYDITHVRYKDGNMLVACDGFFNACTDVVITGPNNYRLVVREQSSNKSSVIKVEDGSTKVTLPKEYLNSLADDTYTVSFTYLDGQTIPLNVIVTTQYTARADTTNPKTGDEIFAPMFVMFSTAAALAVLVMGKKKYF